MSVTVYKFGGASIATPQRMAQLVEIIQSQPVDQLVVVVSALGKMTNSLESVVNAFFTDREKALTLFEEIKNEHFSFCDELFSTPDKIKNELNNHFVEVHWVLEEEPKDSYNYVYDQIVSVGELVSSSMVSAFLKENGLNTKWVDARGLIKTNDYFREGLVQWEPTKQNIQQIVSPLLDEQIVVTQGFIGSTNYNEAITLGREGSDYTGAILANILDANQLTIWKDVDGVLNADPKEHDNTQNLPAISYREAVEMTYYGAKVIHPKTIKPLQNKGIPLHVRSFLTPERKGTVISKKVNDLNSVCIRISKKDQTLLEFTTLDFSFFDEEQVSTVMQALNEHHIRINLLQRGAIHCSFVVDDHPELIQDIKTKLSSVFSIVEKNSLQLATLRHYQPTDIDQLTAGRDILIEQRNPITYQVVHQ